MLLQTRAASTGDKEQAREWSSGRMAPCHGVGPGSIPGSRTFVGIMIARGEVAERSKALRQGRNLFGGVGSNPTLVTFSNLARQSYPSG